MGLLDHSEEQEKVQLNDTNVAYMLEIGRWGKFISIVGFVMIGLMVLLSFFVGSLFSSLPSSSPAFGFSGVFVTIFYLILAAIMLYPTIALYRYSTKIKIAIHSEDQYSFDDAFRNFKNLYKFHGIMLIIFLSIYAIMLIFGFLAAAVFS